MFHFLRKHRRPLSVALLATMAVWLSTVLASCLLPSAQSMSQMEVVAAADMQPHEAMTAVPPCPQGVCAAMESDREPAGDHEIVPATPRLPLAALLLTAVLFIAANPPRGDPFPPEPLLPKRSPTLRFYALRI